MLDEILSYHRIIVEILLFVLVLNLILPLLLKHKVEKMVLWTRIGYFAFWMFWSMNIFSGLIVFMFTGRTLTLFVIAMIIASILLGMLDTYRAIKTKKIWLKGLDASGLSIVILLAEITLIVLVSLLAIRGH